MARGAAGCNLYRNKRTQSIFRKTQITILMKQIKIALLIWLLPFVFVLGTRGFIVKYVDYIISIK